MRTVGFYSIFAIMGVLILSHQWPSLGSNWRVTQDSIFADTLVLGGMNEVISFKNWIAPPHCKITFKVPILNQMSDTLSLLASSGDGNLVPRWRDSFLEPGKSISIFCTLSTNDRIRNYNRSVNVKYRPKGCEKCKWFLATYRFIGAIQ